MLDYMYTEIPVDRLLWNLGYILTPYSTMNITIKHADSSVLEACMYRSYRYGVETVSWWTSTELSLEARARNYTTELYMYHRAPICNSTTKNDIIILDVDGNIDRHSTCNSINSEPMHAYVGYLSSGWFN